MSELRKRNAGSRVSSVDLAEVRLGPLSHASWVLLIALLHVFLGLLLFEPTLFPGGDNAGYMILGESLRTGAGYRDLYLPGAPWHTKYPPLYPAVLALLGSVGGGVVLFKLASLLFTTLAVCLLAFLGRRMIGPFGSLLAALVLAVNPVLLEYAHYVLSEALFVCLVLAALWLWGREGKRSDGWALAAVAGAFLTRTAGLPLLGAAVAVPAFGRRRPEAVRAGAVAMAGAGAWAFYQRLVAPDVPGYLGELLLRNPYQPEAGTVGPSDLLARTAANTWRYVSEVVPESFLGGSGDPVWWMPVLGVALVGLSVGGWIACASRRLGYAELFALLYAGLIAAWPEVWTDRRFLLPLLPLVLLYAVRGAEAIGRRRHAGRMWPGLGLALAIGLCVPSVLRTIQLAPDRISCVASFRAGAPCDPPAFASFYRAARWAGEHTPPEAVIANRKPRLFFWYARRQGDVYRFSSEPELVLADLRAMGATHVVVDPVSLTTVRYLLPAIEAYRERFELVYRGGEPPTAILRFHPSDATTAHGNPSPGGRGASSR